MASNVVCQICRRYDDDCRCDRHTARNLQAQLQAAQQRTRGVAEELNRLAMADPMKGLFDDIRTVRQAQLLRWAATLLGEPVPVDPELHAAGERLAKLVEHLASSRLEQMRAHPLLPQGEQRAQQPGHWFALRDQWDNIMLDKDGNSLPQWCDDPACPHNRQAQQQGEGAAK